MTGYLKQASDGEAPSPRRRGAFEYFDRLARSSEYGRSSGRLPGSRCAYRKFEIGLLDVQPERAPAKVASSLTRPFTCTRAPLVGTRPPCESTVISPVPSSTRYSRTGISGSPTNW
jgi:hypothetical protein